MPEITDLQPQEFVPDITKIRDVEEKLRLLKDRVLLIGQSSIDFREKTFQEVQEIKKIIIKINEENNRIKELLKRIAEQLDNTARKEELNILQRQFDLLRKK